MSVNGDLPVFDFSKYGTENRQDLAEQIVQAFRTNGFVYLKNHGVREEEIQQAMKTASEFFDLPQDTKTGLANITERVQRTSYNTINAEKFDKSVADEMKESFDFVVEDRPAGQSAKVELILDHLASFFYTVAELAKQIFHCLALGLHLQDENIFVNAHQKYGRAEEVSLIRILRYPKIEATSTENTTRLSSHTDFGSLTILFQDDVGGLEVQNEKGVYVPAKPIPGTCLVNLGDLIEIWTSGELRAARHRVRADDPIANSKVRHVIAVFIDTDGDVVVKPLPGRKSFPEILAIDHLRQRYREAYHDDSA